MTKTIEELLNLPPTPNLDETEEDAPQEETSESTDLAAQEEQRNLLTEADSIMDKIDRALPQVRDLEDVDNELDELAKLGKDTFEELIEFGMNVEPRFTKDILNAAASMLGHSITAKTAKVDSKLKRIELQIRKQRLEQQERSKTNTPDNSRNNDDQEEKPEKYDRNTLLATVINEVRKNPKDS